jgi:hypothetical protein
VYATPAPLVQELADREELLDLDAGDVAGPPAGLARDDVVAGVPDDGVVVAQHSERVRRLATLRVDVIDVERDAVGGQGVRVVAEVVRTRGILRR